MELTDHHRWIYHDPSIGGDDPGTGFDDYLATPERIASGVAELASSVAGLAIRQPAAHNISTIRECYDAASGRGPGSGSDTTPSVSWSRSAGAHE